MDLYLAVLLLLLRGEDNDEGLSGAASWDRSSLFQTITLSLSLTARGFYDLRSVSTRHGASQGGPSAPHSAFLVVVCLGGLRWLVSGYYVISGVEVCRGHKQTGRRGRAKMSA